ncbi:uncharacterized protein [Nicotiana sylvestris]|uniref:uncharacterized protein n=1 Tax=Nicotiana sylvestris TaxID=4096 RepID=UPI00388C3FE3
MSEVAVSAILVRKDQVKQSSIYYVSKLLLDAETRYPQLEKLALALIMSSRKLRPYFQCHPISVVTAYPLRNILHKHELSGRLAKWTIELSEYDITYQPRTAIKSQVLANFLDDFSQGMQLEAEKELQVFNGSNPGIWTLFTDGLSNVKGAGLGIVLVPPTGETIRQAIICHSITNNEAEYEAVIASLELARELGINQIIIKSDLQLVVNQMLGTYTAREARMQQYLEKAYRTTTKISTGKTPFLLVYGAEALIPVKIGEPSTRYMQALEESSEEEMRINLDLLEGKREAALIRMTAQKQVMERYYNRRA